jgi:hypothetical protein
MNTGPILIGDARIPGGTDVGALPLVAETGTSKGTGTIQGIVTALNGTTGGTAEQEIQRDRDGKRVLLCFQAMFFWHGSPPFR